MHWVVYLFLADLQCHYCSFFYMPLLSIYFWTKYLNNTVILLFLNFLVIDIFCQISPMTGKDLAFGPVLVSPLLYLLVLLIIFFPPFSPFFLGVGIPSGWWLVLVYPIIFFLSLLSTSRKFIKILPKSANISIHKAILLLISKSSVFFSHCFYFIAFYSCFECIVLWDQYCGQLEVPAGKR